jgi:hypothetical protein
VHLAHPLGLKALRKRKRLKTDPRDAYELANLLRLGFRPRRDRSYSRCGLCA